MTLLILMIREGVNGKKNVFFRALPESPKPPPPSPQFGQLGPLFSEVEIQDLKVSLELKLLYILYRVSLKKGTFLIFCLISVLEVGFYLFICVSESEF